MGSQWTYMELGWGGYWAWDPVENASFLPWITATAFLHSIIIQDRRSMPKVWNLVLIWATYFLVYLVFVAYVFIWLLFTRMPLLRSKHEIDSVLGREAAFLVTTGSSPASPVPPSGAGSSPCSARSSPVSASA